MDRTSRKFSASRRGGRGAGGFRPQESMPYRNGFQESNRSSMSSARGKSTMGMGVHFQHRQDRLFAMCKSLAASRYVSNTEAADLALFVNPSAGDDRESALWATVHSANAKAVKFNQVTSFDSELNKREAALAAAEEKGVEKHSGDLFDCLDSCGGLIDHEKKFREIKTYFADTFGSSTDEH